MKKLILANTLFLLAFYATAQNTLLHDAKVLSAYFNAPSTASQDRVSNKRGIAFDEKAMEVLVKYLPADMDLSTFDPNDDLDNIFKANPFIRLEVTDANLAKVSRSPLDFSGGSSATSPANGFSVSGFADGLSRFLVKRTKQELSQAFFEEFKESINKEPLLGHFCPATRQHLNLVDQDVYQFNKYLEGLREAFVLDMTALPGHTEGYLRDPEMCHDCAKDANGKVMIDMMHLAQQVVDGEAPIDMIDYLARPESAIQSTDATQPVLYNMAGGLRFLDLVSKSLRNPDAKDPMMPWYTAAEIREMFKDPTMQRLYFGLLWQKAGGINLLIKGGTTLPLQSMLGQAAEATATGKALFENWKSALETISGNVHAVQLSVRANASSLNSGSDDFFRFSEALNNLMLSVNDAGQAILQQAQGQQLIPEEYIFYMRQCNSLYFNVRQRNYTGAVSNVIFILSKIEGQLNQGATKDKISLLLKYANFVAAIAEANSPDEVEQAIEMFALPAGSSRMKKQPGRFAVALNAYTGLSLGAEYLQGSSSPKIVGAITAPVGISFSWGMGVKKAKHLNKDKDPKHDDPRIERKNWGSLGFFLPLIDVGAVTAYRFKDSTSQDLPELSWNNIISPGAYIVYDLPGKIPVALGYGGQIGPSLRKVDDRGQFVNKSGWRHGFFATVDIPITYFHLGRGRK